MDATNESGMDRAELVAHVQRAKDRFRARIARVTWFGRNEIAGAVRALAHQVEAVDMDKAYAWRELASLIEVTADEREPPRSRPTPPLPPDNEGDEPLLERMKKFRG